MEKMVNQICITCLKELSGERFDVLDIENLGNMLYVCTSLRIVKDEIFTKFVCETCYDLIGKFFSFRSMCIESYAKLENVKISNHLQTENVSISENENNCDNNHSISSDDSSNSTDRFETKHEESQSDNTPDGVLPEDYKKSKENPIPQRKRSEKKLKCTLCDKTFLKDSCLTAHIRVHQGLKPYGCDECPKEFSKRERLNSHKKSVHCEVVLHICPSSDCSKTFKSNQTLKAHFRRVHNVNSNKPSAFVCELCGKILSSKGALKKHFYIHTGDLPFKCEQCPKKYSTRHKLKEHSMRHNGIKNFVCPHCGLKKTTRPELNIHLNYHTKEKVHECPNCPLIFLARGNLSRHIRIVHQGIKAYPCTFCDRSFGKAETLKHHIMTHTGEKPHECNTCGSRFIQLVALQRHVKRCYKSKTES